MFTLKIYGFLKKQDTTKDVDFDLLFDGAPLIAKSCNIISRILEPNKMINFVL